MTITRLGRGGRLLPPGSRRMRSRATVDALAEYRAAIDAIGGVTRVRATATSAARDARTADEFFSAAHGRAGRHARAAERAGRGAAVVSRCDHRPRRCRTRARTWSSTSAVGPPSSSSAPTPPEGLISVDVGLRTPHRDVAARRPPTAEELSQAVHVVREHLADVLREVPAVTTAKTLVGLAGTVSSFAMIEQGLATYEPRPRAPFPADEGRPRRTSSERSPPRPPRSVATIRASSRAASTSSSAVAIILVTVLRTLGFDDLLTSESDILDGLVRDLTVR